MLPRRKDGPRVADERDGDFRVPHERRRLVRTRLARDYAVQPHSALGEEGVGREFTWHLEKSRMPVGVHPREVENAREDVSARRPRHSQHYRNSSYVLHC